MLDGLGRPELSTPCKCATMSFCSAVNVSSSSKLAAWLGLFILFKKKLSLRIEFLRSSLMKACGWDALLAGLTSLILRARSSSSSGITRFFRFFSAVVTSFSDLRALASSDD
jgi:hypothetical protein